MRIERVEVERDPGRIVAAMGSALLVLFALWVLWPIAAPVLWAALVSYLLWPVNERVQTWIRPDGIRGLVAEAVGAPTLPSVDVGTFLEQTMEKGGFWELVDTIRHRHQPITVRARELYQAGFFDRERDHARWIAHVGAR